MNTLGIYILGARGNVATLAAAGASAISQGLAQATGTVTSASDFAELPLTDYNDMLFGGCDLAPAGLDRKLIGLADQGRMLAPELARKLAPVMQKLDQQIDPALKISRNGVPEGGYLAAVKEITERFASFKERNDCERLVFVNLISTEAAIFADEHHASAASFEQALASDLPGLANISMLYTWAAINAGIPVVNFTPSQSLEIPAIAERAKERNVPHAGKDGKTGETLLKTVLGPMFVARGLKVKSWLANNYLGNNDGLSLNEPDRRATKLESKDQALRSILGDDAHLATDIGYAPSLDDWKTAWDLIHFEGFLGTMMTMQFTWQGCDSALASPLVLDLIRLLDFANRMGEGGALGYLASFFKSPQGVEEHGFAEQLAMLSAHVRKWKEAGISVA